MDAAELGNELREVRASLEAMTLRATSAERKVEYLRAALVSMAEVVAEEVRGRS